MQLLCKAFLISQAVEPGCITYYNEYNLNPNNLPIYSTGLQFQNERSPDYRQKPCYNYKMSITLKRNWNEFSTPCAVESCLVKFGNLLIKWTYACEGNAHKLPLCVFQFGNCLCRLIYFFSRSLSQRLSSSIIRTNYRKHVLFGNLRLLLTFLGCFSPNDKSGA